MTQFEVSRIFTAQGASKAEMALTLESLIDGELLPTWGEGSTGAELSTREVVSIILGATSTQPENASAHVATVAGFIRADGRSLGEILTKIMESEPADIGVEEITVSPDLATIRYSGGGFDTFTVNGSLGAFRHTCIIRGSALQAIAMVMHFPTASGWTDPRPEEA